MRQMKLLSIICIMLFTACETTTNNAPSQTNNGSPQVQPLTRIAKTGEGVLSVPTSKQIAISRGQVIFVPAYSHVYYGNQQEQFPLAVTLSIRNTSLTDPIVIRSIRYYNSSGKLAKEYTSGNLQLAPLATTEFFIQQQDSSGGSGANFIVEWVTDKQGVTEPIIEAVMISTSFQQGVSFTTSGRVIQELTK
jgi:Protein of unknown function (DUF3124)